MPNYHWCLLLTVVTKPVKLLSVMRATESLKNSYYLAGRQTVFQCETPHIAEELVHCIHDSTDVPARYNKKQHFIKAQMNTDEVLACSQQNSKALIHIQ